MWNYIKHYLHFAVLAALCMVGEVLMDLIQPRIMRQIVDDGVLGLNTAGGNLQLIWALGLQMIILVLFGGLCGSLNNVFVHLSAQNIGNEIKWRPETAPYYTIAAASCAAIAAIPLRFGCPFSLAMSVSRMFFTPYRAQTSSIIAQIFSPDGLPPISSFTTL